MQQSTIRETSLTATVAPPGTYGNLKAFPREELFVEG
jgi:hypothetical protein